MRSDGESFATFRFLDSPPAPCVSWKGKHPPTFVLCRQGRNRSLKIIASTATHSIAMDLGASSLFFESKSIPDCYRFVWPLSQSYIKEEMRVSIDGDGEGGEGGRDQSEPT